LAQPTGALANRAYRAAPPRLFPAHRR
jgi:hypothetical protein